MWRIYSQNKDGVRVTTTPRKLLNALKDSVGEYAELKCFLGQVQYKRKTALLESLKSIDLLSTDGSGIAESLLYKRVEFSHEKEVRLIYCGDDSKCSSDLCDFKIDPDSLFDRILFDPRMEDELKIAYKLAIAKKNCNVEIKRSALYDAPKNFTFNI